MIPGNIYTTPFCKRPPASLHYWTTGLHNCKTRLPLYGHVHRGRYKTLWTVSYVCALSAVALYPAVPYLLYACPTVCTNSMS